MEHCYTAATKVLENFRKKNSPKVPKQVFKVPRKPSKVPTRSGFFCLAAQACEVALKEKPVQTSNPRIRQQLLQQYGVFRHR